MTDSKLHGIVEHTTDRKTDYLYRVSLKCLIMNKEGDVLVVKENGRDWWDLPGGGMDHGEDLKQAIARELEEEVKFDGDFSFSIIDLDKPMFLDVHGFWQLRLIFHVTPESFNFSPGIDADEIRFINPLLLKDSDKKTEQRVYSYVKGMQSI